jgi:hypothetical protein
MNPQDPLANLHPLREPGVIGWWPLAPGWWVLLAIAILALVALAWFLIRRYRANAYRRRALAQLAGIYTDFDRDGDSGHCLQQVNALLKSVALRAWPRRQVAAATGEAWLAFLNGSSGGGELFDARYGTALYRGGEPDLDMAAIRAAATRWIVRHEVAA